MPENEEAEIPLCLLRCLGIYQAWPCALHLNAGHLSQSTQASQCCYSAWQKAEA